MQKVVGSNPISRSERKPRSGGVFSWPEFTGSGAKGLRVNA